jgi:ankyrin repeat protein
MQSNKLQINLDTELIQAVLNNDLTNIKQLIKSGANIHYLEDLPIITAAEKGYLDIVKYLVDIGANLNSQDYSILQAASSEGHLNILYYIFEHIYISDLDRIQDILERIGYSPVIYSIQAGHIDIFKYYIETIGVDPEWAQNTFLIEAVIGGRLDIVQYLVENYNVYIPSQDDAALRISIRFNNNQLRDYLIEEALSMDQLTREHITTIFDEEIGPPSPTDSGYSSPITNERNEFEFDPDQADSDQADSDQADSDSDQADSDSDSDQADSDQADSDQADSDQADSDQADSDQADSDSDSNTRMTLESDVSEEIDEERLRRLYE